MSIMLKSSSSIAWSGEALAGVDLQQVHFGPDPKGLGGFEIATAISSHSPSTTELKQLHKSRLSGRDTSLVVAVVHGETVWMFGPDNAVQPQKQPKDGATRHLQAALNEGDSLQATKRFLSLSDAHSQTQMPGVRNKGLFATYHLRENTKRRADWAQYQSNSAQIIHSRSRQLIEELGFVVSETANHTFVLNDSADATRAVALLLDESESFENESPRFHSSPVAWGLSIAAERGVPWLIMLRKEQIRLYPARDGVGVGQKGQTETYLELDLAGLGEDYMGLLTLVFSAEALGEKGTAQELLDESVRYAMDLGTRLRERIYDRVVPNLAKAVALEMRTLGTELDVTGLQDAYRTTLRILFRFLFQAYAEDRGLLPAGRNNHFDEHSLTLFASRAVERDEEYGQGTGLWEMLQQVWEAIDVGNEEWRVPAYNGGLFGSDPELRPYGALIKKLSLPDSAIGHALEALLIDQTEDQVTGMVDFRSLSVREFGTIYEGLLESSLSLADSDLALDANGIWFPAGPGDVIEARAGEPYFHNTSGERKATGSYFTPDFVVDHLIERSIDPSLDDHLSRIKALIDDGKDNEAAKKFFDYRVADLAMGSAHFLVAAVDRIESKLRSFLAQPGNEIAGVSNELERLAEAARKALGDDVVAIDDVDDAVLLRRQIARRCVYGIDVNPLAVELSRLALWIHTFVPGLPMSTLDHNLVCANSLTGIGSIEEAERALELSGDDSQLSLFESVIRDALSDASELLLEWSDASEATRAEVRRAHELAKLAEEKSKPVKGMLDVALASIAGVVDRKQILEPNQISGLADLETVKNFIDSVQPAHMPFLFPEVFVRENPGFDAIVGNPPWETLAPDERKFWALKFPGFMSLSVAEREKSIRKFRASRPDLVAELERVDEAMRAQRETVRSKYPINKARPDLSEMFVWAYLNLTRTNGQLGVVLPRTAFTSKALTQWRKLMLEMGSFTSLVTATNSGRWLFDIHPQYSIALCVYRKSLGLETRLGGPFASREAFLRGRDSSATFDNSSLLSFTGTHSFPTVGDSTTAKLIQKIRQAPSIVDWRGAGIRSVQEFNATTDRPIFEALDPQEPVKVISGRGFDLWEPNTGSVFAQAERAIVHTELIGRLRNQVKLKSSAFYGYVWPEDFRGKLPYERSRIALRNLTNPTNRRTVIAALLPPMRILPNTAPYLLFRPGSERQEALLLATLSSIPLDWYARKFVESSLMTHLLHALPIPDFSHPTVEQRSVFLAGSLAAVDEQFEDWADAVNVPVGALLNEKERDEAICELDALVSIAYGLERQQVEHIYESFHRGWDYLPRLGRVLEFYDEWKAKT